MLRARFAAVLAVQVMVCPLGAREAAAQFPSLPEVDAVNASVQVGTIEPQWYSTVPMTAHGKGLWGFGLESEFKVPLRDGSSWEATLGVGINYLNLEAEVGGRRLRGNLRDLPMLSLYFGRSAPNQPYFGISLGISELSNGRLHRDVPDGEMDPGPIKLSGSAMSPGVAIGFEFGFEHVGGFVELGYVARLFPSVAYEGLPASGFPDDLGERLYTGGVMLRVGGTVALKAEKTTKEDKVSCGSRSVTVVHEKDQTIRPKCDEDYLLIEFVDPPKVRPRSR